MATAAANTKVERLRAEGRAKAEEGTCYMEELSPDQAATMTEIGWSIAATAAHLAASAGFTRQQLKQLKRGKAPRVPGLVIDLSNLIASRASKKKPLAESAAKLRANTEQALALLDDWSDAELATRFAKPYYGAETYEDALRYSLIGHLDEHIDQVRRAMGI